MAESNKYVMVASIDFGTTYSGYAFSFHGKETEIKLNKNWGNAQGFLSYKAPTCVLLDANGKFEAFGFQAEQKYLEALEDYEDEQPVSTRKQLFRNFKMILHREKNVSLKSTILSVGKTEAPAIDVFVHALKYIKSHLFTELSKELATSPNECMIRWVITVPAIWSEKSKQFMRETAFRAGLMADKSSKQLIIALEPEAASFYCRKLDLAQFANRDNISFPPGTNYLVLDCGGGTNDLVAHTILEGNKIKELFAVNGGSLGGNKINEKFVELLQELLGEDFIKSFQAECPEQWFNFMVRFERSKKMAEDDGDTRLKVELPSEMKEMYEIQNNQKQLKDILTRKDRGIRFVSGSLVLSYEIVRNLFRYTVDQIIQGVKDNLGHREYLPFQYIFMVGGFCESSFLQNAVKTAFQTDECRVLIPQEAVMAVIKGAVLYGHYFGQIVSRISRFTYGIRCRRTFIDRLHRNDMLCISSNGLRECQGLFETLVEIGEEVEIGSTKEFEFHVGDPGQTRFGINIYNMNRKPTNVEYIDHPDFNSVGKMVLETPINENAVRRNFAIKVTFGGTELHIEGVDKASGNTMSTTIDFHAE